MSSFRSMHLSISDLPLELKCLRHLRELRADGNKIIKLDGLEDSDGLLKLSLEGNQLREARLAEFRW